MKRTITATTLFCLALLLTSSVPLTAAGDRVVLGVASLDLERAALRLPLGGFLRLEGLQLEIEGAPAVAELERFRVFEGDAQIVVHGADGDTYLPVPANAYFRGRLEGIEGSRVVFSVLEAGGARGLVTVGDRTWMIGNAAGARAAGPTLTAREILPGELAGRSFSCDTHLLPPPPERSPAKESVPGQPARTAKGAIFTARIAYDTDQEYLALFSGDTTAANNYIGDLTAHASAIYESEVGTTWTVASITLWSTTDPWTETDTGALLDQLSTYWNVNNPMPGTPPRTLAHLLSARPLGGGIAWRGVLCSDDIGYGLSADITSGFDISDPQSVWDIYVLTHEVGHNFDSDHTHCYMNVGGSPSPIDECYNGEADNPNCWGGAASLPAGCPGEGQHCGTIMSYCHLLEGDLDNVALTLGQGHPYGVMPERVPTVQRAHVEEAAAANPACLAFVVPSIFTDGFESGDTTAWSAATH